MKILILNGASKGNGNLRRINDLVVREIKKTDNEVEVFTLHDMKITYCLGCFECWTKTPGICRFNDDGRKVAKSFIRSDIVVFFTPVTFGGYSSDLKKALDRIISLVLPFFKKVNGETHHKLRYDKYPKLLAIGVMEEQDEESERIFENLFKRNVKNFFPPSSGLGTILINEQKGQILIKIRSLLNGIGIKE